MAAEYRIVDEPKPSAWSHLVVNPFWIFFATMLGGAAFGWIWFAVNSVAVGSATRDKEIGYLVLGGAMGTFGLLLVLAGLSSAGILPVWSSPYLPLVFFTYKMAITYFVYLAQARSFQLHEYFGGKSRNGVLLVVLAVFARLQLADRLGAWGVLLF